MINKESIVLSFASKLHRELPFISRWRRTPIALDGGEPITYPGNGIFFPDGQVTKSIGHFEKLLGTKTLKGWDGLGENYFLL